MSKPISFGRVETHLISGERDFDRTPSPETPFRILLLGDFSGRGSRKGSQSRIGTGRPVPIDRDNLGEIMARLDVGLQLFFPNSGNVPIVLRFAEMEDFHPDRIFARLNIFQNLRCTRQALLNPSTFPAAAEQVKQWAAKVEGTSRKPGDTQTESQLAQSDPNRISADFLLEGMLERQRASQTADEWSTMLREVVKPYVLPKEDPKLAELVEVVEAAIGGLMRELLHHPSFQALEAAWRGVDFLVRELETGAELQLFLLDLTKDELSADLQSSEDLRLTQTYRRLVEESIETPGAEPWALIGGNYAFDAGLVDVEVLGRLAKVARQAGAPFIAAAHSSAVGCLSLAETPDPRDWTELSDSEREAWKALRGLPEAAYLGLALPRFLLRLPYGKLTEPIEEFAFEEWESTSSHESYLWGNPTFVCAYLLAQAFSESGWNLTPGEVQDLGGLPFHVYEDQGQSVTKPCAEVPLTERAAEAILDSGVMPLLSMKGLDTVRLARFQSIALPLASLAGRWS